MHWRLLAWAGVAVAALVPIIGGGWLLTLPVASAFKVPPPIAQDETDATLAALKPPKRQRPLIAIVGINDMSETTDYLMIVGVCAGGKVVASTGLLDGRRATTHWFYLKDWRDNRPDIHYVANRRIVVDRGVATTTGISASMPMSLTLIEAIAGRAKAQAVAREIGLPDWDARHDSGAFKFTRPFALTAIGNTLAFWNREQLGLLLSPGVDEVSLALVADSWSRTYRSHAVTFAATDGAQTTRNGLRIYPQAVAASWPTERLLPAVETTPPAQALDQALRAIETRYGDHTANFVAVQLEYPRGQHIRRAD